MERNMARVAAVSPRVWLGNCRKNADSVIRLMRSLEGEGVQAAVFPELCLTGYTCGDLFLNEAVQRDALAALKRVAEASGPMAVMVGLPLSVEGRLYNCAAVAQNGLVRGIAAKCHLPNGGEFYETRWFVSGRNAPDTAELFGRTVPFGMNLMFQGDAFSFAVEICEDLWNTIPPSSYYAPAGAEVIFNLSASNELAAKHGYRRQLLAQQSARCFVGYVYAGAGYGESTTDLVFSGYCGVYENGRPLSEGPLFSREGGRALADVDLQRLRYQRQRTGSFFNGSAAVMRTVPLDPMAKPEGDFRRPMDMLPFVPKGDGEASRCQEITAIQAAALLTRMEAAHLNALVVGVSGGLDSTLALLIAAETFGQMGLSPKNIHAVTMPGFGTGSRTYQNAQRLMEALHTSVREVDIGPAVLQHFRDIGQEESKRDVTYENSQARERTQILMDYANKVGGLVLGTGDLSEAALGFSTYNGDHMSMYNVNCSVPKTLVRALVRFLSRRSFGEEVARICDDIIDTPISPELLPADQGELSQRTEEILGDYALHDFFLYHMMDSGASAQRLYAFALQAFRGAYPGEAVEKALRLFMRRFFTQQFKRSCMPDGPKVGSVSLSPRGDWRMPSDMDGNPFAPD